MSDVPVPLSCERLGRIREVVDAVDSWSAEKHGMRMWNAAVELLDEVDRLRASLDSVGDRKELPQLVRDRVAALGDRKDAATQQNQPIHARDDRSAVLIWPAGSTRGAVTPLRVYRVTDINDAGDLCFLDDDGDEQWLADLQGQPEDAPTLSEKLIAAAREELTGDELDRVVAGLRFIVDAPLTADDIARGQAIAAESGLQGQEAPQSPDGLPIETDPNLPLNTAVMFSRDGLGRIIDAIKIENLGPPVEVTPQEGSDGRVVLREQDIVAPDRGVAGLADRSTVEPVSPPRDCRHICCPDRDEIAHLHDVDPEDCFDCKALAEPVSDIEAKALRIGARIHPGLLPEEKP